MKPPLKSLAEIRREGYDALLERLGPAGLFRFLQQFDSGSGDYSRDRHSALDSLTIEEIVQQARKSNEPK